MSNITNPYEFGVIDPVGMPCLYCGFKILPEDSRVVVQGDGHHQDAAHSACSDEASIPKECSKIDCTQRYNLTQHRLDGGSGVVDRWAFCPKHENSEWSPRG